MSKLDFLSTSQFKTKLDLEQNKLRNLLQQVFLKDLLKLSDEESQDIDLHIQDENIHLKHRCIITAICSSFPVEESEAPVQSIILETYPSCVHDYEKNLFKYIYNPGDGKVFNDTNLAVNFSMLLKDSTFTDVKFKIDDVEFKCHTCLLSIRCEYFSRMLSGDWKEDTLDVIELKGISSDTFHLILSYIYSGQMVLNEDTDLVDLLSASDMYMIPGIRQIVALHLKAHFCHFFLHVCESCIRGVITSLELCQIFQLDELRDECYNWFVRDYAKLFSNRGISKCSEQIRSIIAEKIKDSIASANVIRHFKDCNKLKQCLPSVKWAQTIRSVAVDIEDFAAHFVCDNFGELCAQASFSFCLYNDKDINSALMLEDSIVNAISKHISKVTCLDIFAEVKKMQRQAGRMKVSLGIGETSHPNKQEAYENCVKFIKNLYEVCKDFVKKNLFQIQKTKKWKELHDDMKKELLESSGFVTIGDDFVQLSLQDR